MLNILFLYLQMIAFVVASPYVSTQLNQQGIQNMQGFLYSVITELSFSQSYMVLYSFPADIALMLREVNNKVYSAAPFYFSKALSLVGDNVICSECWCEIGRKKFTGLDARVIFFRVYGLTDIHINTTLWIQGNPK